MTMLSTTLYGAHKICIRRRWGVPALNGPRAPTRHQLPRAGGGDDAGFTPLENAALREASDLLRAAQDISEQQTRAELMSSLVADADAQKAEGQPTEENLRSFWIEQGLRSSEAQRLVRELQESSMPSMSLGQLAAKMHRLERILPDSDVAALVYKDFRLLSTPSSLMVENMVALIGLGFQDVISMISKQPGLLAMEGLTERGEQVLSKMISIHPSKSRKVVADIVEENPSLLVRMQYYMDASLEELPIEIQNMMVIADHGIGFLYRYYKGQQQAGGHPDRATGNS